MNGRRAEGWPVQSGSPEEEKSESHIPKMLEWEQTYGVGHVVDERGFEIFDPSTTNPEIFETELVRGKLKGVFSSETERRSDEDTVRGLIQSLGRLPTPVEVRRERFRQQIFAQIKADENNPLYISIMVP